MNVDNTKEFRLLSLCAGYAGIELGLRRAVPILRTVAYVEIEAFACANLVAKMEKGLLDAAPIWTDIKTFDAKSFRDRIHIVTAGYPCQPFSSAGRRLGKEDPRYLWPYIERIVRTVRPAWCFFENVEGHLKLGFSDIYRSLREMGYAVEAGLFSAAEVRAPHRRKRLFVLAHRYNRRCKRITVLQTGQSPIEYGYKMLANTQNTKRRKLSKKYIGRGIKKVRGPNRMWPARPGQAQYEWEEPRIVEYSRKQKSERIPQSKGRNKNRKTGNTSGKRQTQSRLGRAVDGAACRVDRLQLLGNGVVPQQAELAFRTLLKKHESNR